MTLGRRRSRLFDGSFDTVGEREPQTEVPFQSDVRRRRMGDHEVRRRSGELRPVAHLGRPSIGPIDDVEQSATHHHGAGLRRGPLEDLGVDRILIHHPGVELLGVSEPVLGIGPLPGHVAVQRHRDVSDDLRHPMLLSVIR